MAISNVLERLGRVVFESPFESRRLIADAPELAEVRLLATDAIQEKSHRIDGKTVFPYDLIRIRLLGVPAGHEAIFGSEFLRSYFAEELKVALRRGGCRYPETLAVEFVTSERLPSSPERWVSVEVAMRAQPVAAEVNAQHAPAVLKVLQGRANPTRLTLKKVRTNIGRTEEVFRGVSPSRRNDLAFDGSEEAGKTVSREHAHIVRVPAENVFRLFNDRTYRGEGNCGLWIVRDGLSFPVHHGKRGTLLRHGDQIHLGTAVLLFSCDEGVAREPSGAA